MALLRKIKETRLGQKVTQIITHILSNDGSPYQISLGVAIGVFIAWTPTIGIQMILGALFAHIAGASRAAAVAVVWISNPYTAVPIYYFNYLVGYWIVGGEQLNKDWFRLLINPSPESLDGQSYLRFAYEKIAGVALPLTLGSVLIGAILAIVSYFLLYRYLQLRKSKKLHTNTIAS